MHVCRKSNQQLNLVGPERLIKGARDREGGTEGGGEGAAKGRQQHFYAKNVQQKHKTKCNI